MVVPYWLQLVAFAILFYFSGARICYGILKGEKKVLIWGLILGAFGISLFIRLLIPYG